MSVISTAHSFGNFSTTSMTQAMPIMFNVNTTISRLAFFVSSPATIIVTPRIWSSSKTLLVSGTTTSGNAENNTSAPLWAPISYNFIANTLYWIGGYSSANSTYVINTATTHNETTTTEGIILSIPLSNNSYWASGDATNPFVSGNSGYEFSYFLDVVIINLLPTAPTGVSVTNSPVTVNIQPNVIWTHNDPEGSLQAKYQLRWRKVD